MTTNGGVKCWGYNHDGQLGDGTTTTRYTPVNVMTLNSGVSALAAGERHTCALMTSGSVKCWGYNFYGQLGGGPAITYTTPVDVIGLGGEARAVTTGMRHTCSLMGTIPGSGSVKCWGYNHYGQLGNGTTSFTETRPVDVVLNTSVNALAAGDFYTCALTTSGGVKCWGANVHGQLGKGTITVSETRPVDVLGLSSGMGALTLGGRHTCASTTNGNVKCWGDNAAGQLGDGTTTIRTTPTDVVGLSSVVSTTVAGEMHTCTLLTSGGVKCWGNNSDGELGDGTTNSRLTPVDVLVPVYQVLLPIIVKLPMPSLSWQRLGQPQLNIAVLTRQGDQLFAGERKDTGYPGGLYKRSLATCATAPDLIRFPTIDSSVLGLALQGSQGVIAAYDIGMLYTNNGGDTWTQSSSKVSNPRTVEMSSGIIYAATENDGLSYSEDGGITWTPRSGEPKAINVLKIQASTVWIGTDTTGVWKLIAGGSAPVQQNNGLNNNASREIWDLGFAADNMIYLATEDGVYRGSGNTNSPWQPFDIELKRLRSLEFVGDQLYAGVLQGGVWQHALTGGNWQSVTSPGWNNTLTVRDLFYDANNCHGLLAATNDGIWLYR